MLLAEEPEVLVPDNHEEHIDFSRKMDIGQVLIKEFSPEGDEVCLAFEEGVNNREEIIECGNSRFPMSSPEGCDNPV